MNAEILVLGNLAGLIPLMIAVVLKEQYGCKMLAIPLIYLLFVDLFGVLI